MHLAEEAVAILGVGLALVMIAIDQRGADRGNNRHHRPEDRGIEVDSEGIEKELDADEKDQLVGEIFEFGQGFQEFDKEIGGKTQEDNAEDPSQPDDDDLVAHGDGSGDAVDGKSDIGQFDDDHCHPEGVGDLRGGLIGILGTKEEHVLHRQIDQVTATEDLEDHPDP